MRRHTLQRAALAAVMLVNLPITALRLDAAEVTAQNGVAPPVTSIRYYPREGNTQRMIKGRFVGSNASATTDFETIAEIKEAPADGQWSEIKLAKPVLYRFLKYEAPFNSWGNVAEIEFYSGDNKISGTGFGTTGSKDNAGNDFSKALDGKTDTYFDANEANNQYVGIDLGPQSQAATPQFAPPPGSYETAQTVTISSPTPGAKIRISRWGNPTRSSGDEYKGPITINKGEVLSVVAYTDTLAASPVVVAAYRIGAKSDGKTVRTFHIGNSLTDTINGWMEPLAQSAGKSLAFHRFTIPGAPTDWLWTHPGSGFGDNRYKEAFFALAPIDHIFTQPFAGHSRSVENEAEHSGKFFEAAREHSPNIQAWLYVQWPGPEFKDNWAQGKGISQANLKPATTWQEGVSNHLAYAEAVRERINETYKGKPVLIVPGGLALAKLKTEMDEGKVPGMTDFFKEIFSDGIHMTDKGRYMIALVHHAVIWKENPEDKVPPLNSKLTPEQAKIFQRIAWEAAKTYPYAGIAPLPKKTP